MTDSDFSPEDPLSPAASAGEQGLDTSSANPGESAPTTRTTVSVSLQGDVLERLKREQTETGYSLQKILRDYADTHIRLRDEEDGRLAETAGKGLLMNRIEDMEARMAQAQQRHSEELAVLGIMMHLVIAHLDAKARWDFATTPDLSERPSKEVLDKRYEVLTRHTVAGINHQGQATIVGQLLRLLEAGGSGE